MLSKGHQPDKEPREEDGRERTTRDKKSRNTRQGAVCARATWNCNKRNTKEDHHQTTDKQHNGGESLKGRDQKWESTRPQPKKEEESNQKGQGRGSRRERQGHGRPRRERGGRRRREGGQQKQLGATSPPLEQPEAVRVADIQLDKHAHLVHQVNNPLIQTRNDKTSRSHI